MKNATEMLRESEDKFLRDCRDVAAAAGVAPEPCITRKPTPIEALELQIKLPWDGKVQALNPEDLTKETFSALEKYGVMRNDIRRFFGFPGVPAFYAWIAKNAIPPKHSKDDLMKAAFAGEIKMPSVEATKGEVKLTFDLGDQAVEVKDKSPAKTSETKIRSKNLTIGSKQGKKVIVEKETPEPRKPRKKQEQIAAQLAATRVGEIVQERFESAIAGTGPMPGPDDATPIVAQAIAEQVAEATREQVEEFFTEPATGGFVSKETSQQINVQIHNAGKNPAREVGGDAEARRQNNVLDAMTSALNKQIVAAEFSGYQRIEMKNIRQWEAMQAIRKILDCTPGNTRMTVSITINF